jgi:hypothetical protein
VTAKATQAELLLLLLLMLHHRFHALRFQHQLVLSLF